jgi:hypothetical protein
MKKLGGIITRLRSLKTNEFLGCFAGKIPGARIVFLQTEGLTGLSQGLLSIHRNREGGASQPGLEQRGCCLIVFYLLVVSGPSRRSCSGFLSP